MLPPPAFVVFAGLIFTVLSSDVDRGALPAPSNPFSLRSPASMLSWTSLLGTVDPAANCVKVGEWADRNWPYFPGTISELSKYPILHRRAIFRRLPKAEQQSLWAEHLQSYLEPGAKLMPEQRAVVQQALEDLDGLMQASESGDRRRKELAAEAQKVFERLEIAAVFGRLGPTDLLGPFAASALPIECFCNTGVSSDFCNPNFMCWASTVCIWQSIGCGWLWLQECDGECYRP